MATEARTSLGVPTTLASFQRQRLLRQQAETTSFYGDASQALWRSNPSSGRGPDATAGFTWSPADRNFNNRELTLGLRLNELIPSRTHYNTVAFGYVRSGFTNDILPGHGSLPAHSENGLELSALILLNRAVFVSACCTALLRHRRGFEVRDGSWLSLQS